MTRKGRSATALLFIEEFLHNYDLAINAALGHDACVNMILAAAEAKEKTMEG